MSRERLKPKPVREFDEARGVWITILPTVLPPHSVGIDNVRSLPKDKRFGGSIGGNHEPKSY